MRENAQIFKISNNGESNTDTEEIRESLETIIFIFIPQMWEPERRWLRGKYKLLKPTLVKIEILNTFMMIEKSGSFKGCLPKKM